MPNQIQAVPRAIVVGAGIGGLTAAWRLQQAGYAVSVFEKEAQAAGRIKSLQLAGCVIDTGATVFLPAYRETLALIDELGLSGELQAIRGAAIIPRNGQLHAIDIDAPFKALFTPALSWRSKFSLIRVALRFWTLRKSFNFTTLGSASGQDHETLADYCRAHLPAEAYEVLLNPVLKFLYLHNGDSGSLIELLWWLAATGLGKPRSLRRGSSSLTDALTQRLQVQTRSEVTHVERAASGARVTVQSADGSEQVHHADVCVISVPGTIAVGISSGDALTATQREFLRTRRYDPSIVVSMVTRQRPALDALMFMVPDRANADLATLIFGHNIGAQRCPPERGLINAYFIRSWCERHGHETDEALLRRAQDALRAWVPEVDALQAFNVQRWSHTAAISEVGDCAKIQAFEDDVDPASPVQFIGDYQAQASMNVAVANANRVVQRLLRHRKIPA